MTHSQVVSDGMARLQYRVSLTSEKQRSPSVITNGSGERVEVPKRFRSSELDGPVLIVGGLHLGRLQFTIQQPSGWLQASAVRAGSGFVSLDGRLRNVSKLGQK